MDYIDDLTLATFFNVIVTRIGNTGKETYEPATITFKSVRSKGLKGWIVRRNTAGNALVFNAYVPSGIPVLLGNRRTVRFGKVPSLSFVSKNGQ